MPINLSRRWLTALALVLPVFSCQCVSRSTSCNYQKGGKCSVSVNGVTRTYVLHVPPNFRPGSSALVIAFHGARGSGSQFEANTDLDIKADHEGFAVAYPDGLPNSGGATSWNAYFNPTYGPNAPDDSGFTRQLILALQSNLHPDPKKIYVTGFSAGGHMAHRVAIDHSDLVAAAGIIEGSIWVQDEGGAQKPPQAKTPVSVLILHGDADPVVRYCGVSNEKILEASQDQTFDYWSQTPANACKSFNTTSNLCTGFLGSPTSVMVKDATRCTSNAEVKLYRLIGGLHQWYEVPFNVPPGNSARPYNANLNSSTGVTTNDLLWNFFAAHAKP
jgi:polyhydroxybutyrate depolymerase